MFRAICSGTVTSQLGIVFGVHPVLLIWEVLANMAASSIWRS